MGTVALVLFGPDKLPGFARQIGRVTREIQSTGQSFIREIERAGDESPEEREARRVREQGMHPPPRDYAATLAARPPRISDEPAATVDPEAASPPDDATKVMRRLSLTPEESAAASRDAAAAAWRPADPIVPPAAPAVARADDDLRD